MLVLPVNYIIKHNSIFVPKTIIFLLVLPLLFFTNTMAFAIGDCTNLMKSISTKNADMFKIAKISLSCDSKNELICKQNSRSFNCEAIKEKLNTNAKVFQKYTLVEFIESQKRNTPTGYQKKLQTKPIYLSKKDTKAFCSFLETDTKKPCSKNINDSEPISGTEDDLWFSFRFLLDTKAQAYVYAYETKDLNLSVSCDLASNASCSSSSESTAQQDLMKKNNLLSLIRSKK